MLILWNKEHMQNRIKPLFDTHLYSGVIFDSRLSFWRHLVCKTRPTVKETFSFNARALKSQGAYFLPCKPIIDAAIIWCNSPITSGVNLGHRACIKSSFHKTKNDWVSAETRLRNLSYSWVSMETLPFLTTSLPLLHKMVPRNFKWHSRCIQIASYLVEYDWLSWVTCSMRRRGARGADMFPLRIYRDRSMEEADRVEINSTISSGLRL